jgi:hypothetical protein
MAIVGRPLTDELALVLVNSLAIERNVVSPPVEFPDVGISIPLNSAYAVERD